MHLASLSLPALGYFGGPECSQVRTETGPHFAPHIFAVDKTPKASWACADRRLVPLSRALPRGQNGRVNRQVRRQVRWQVGAKK